MLYQESIYAHLQKVYSLSIIRFSAVRNKYSGLVFQLPSDSFMVMGWHQHVARILVHTKQCEGTANSPKLEDEVEGASCLRGRPLQLEPGLPTEAGQAATGEGWGQAGWLPRLARWRRGNGT